MNKGVLTCLLIFCGVGKLIYVYYKHTKRKIILVQCLYPFNFLNEKLTSKFTAKHNMLVKHQVNNILMKIFSPPN